MKNKVLIVLIGIFALTLSLNSCTNQDKKSAQTEKSGCCKEKTALYACQMDKDVTADKPVKCSKCGMDLVKQNDKSAKVAEAKTCTCPSKCECKSGKPCICGSSCKCPLCEKAVAKSSSCSVKDSYVCPMNCGCKSGAPCKCPKCGKDMVKQKAQAVSSSYVCPASCGCKSGAKCTCVKCGMNKCKSVRKQG